MQKLTKQQCDNNFACEIPRLLLPLSMVQAFGMVHAFFDLYETSKKWGPRVVRIFQDVHWFWLRSPLGSSYCSACMHIPTKPPKYVFSVFSSINRLIEHINTLGVFLNCETCDLPLFEHCLHIHVEGLGNIYLSRCERLARAVWNLDKSWQWWE